MGRKSGSTTGLVWLNHSLRSFNGSGYAKKDNAEEYLTSYIVYKMYKGNPDEALLAADNYEYGLKIADKMLLAKNAGKYTSQFNLHRFNQYYNNFVKCIK